jgi:D-arabinose 1-dehydrogenase-like Zn-dependent alcohol dehydrogenase
MRSPDYARTKIQDLVPFEQAALLMCTGITMWDAVIEANIKAGLIIAIVGLGGLGVLGVQFAKALGCKVIDRSAYAIGRGGRIKIR